MSAKDGLEKGSPGVGGGVFWAENSLTESFLFALSQLEPGQVFGGPKGKGEFPFSSCSLMVIESQENTPGLSSSLGGPLPSRFQIQPSNVCT